MESTPRDPEAAKLGDVRIELDVALKRVRSVEDATLFPAALERALAEALQQVYVALATTSDWRAFRGAIAIAAEQLRVGRLYLSALPSEDPAAVEILSAITECAAALGRLGLDMGEPLSLPSDARGEAFVPASRGVPRTIDLRRGVVRPAVPIHEPAPREELAPVIVLARAKSRDEMSALAADTQAMLARLVGGPRRKRQPEPEPPRFDEDALARERFGVALSDHELLAERARDYLEDLSMLGRMRRPAELEAWASGDDCEERMLAKIDAIAACGTEVLPELVRVLDERPIPDPELTFGNVLVFGCLAGDDAWEQAKRLVEVADLSDPEMHTMLADALVFAPHPRIDEHLPGWLESADADRRALAVEALRRRGTLDLRGLEIAARDDDPRVVASAVRALPRLRSSSGLLGYALHHPSELVVRAALEAAMLLRSERGPARAAELAREGRIEWAEAAMSLAIEGARASRPLFEDAMGRGAHPVGLRALGWYGDATFVPFLLGRMESDEPLVRDAALDALERITGASLTERVTVRSYAPTDLPFRRARREHEPAVPLSTDASCWRAWWKEHGSLARPDDRYRWGHRFSVADTRRELAFDEFPFRDRPFAAMELAWHRGGEPPDWLAWVSVQRAQLGGAA